MNRSTILVLIAGAAVLSGCRAVGPDYQRPSLAAPDRFAGGAPDAAKPEQAADLARWWDRLGDPKLSTLIDRALAGNFDLRVAASRVREARALRGVAAAGNKPTLDATSGASRSRSSERAENAFGAEKEATSFDVGLDASWEIDLFGAVRRGVEAADADLAAAQEGGREVLVSLTAEVATSYVQLRSFQARIKVVEDAIRAQRDTVELLDSRLQAGLSAELELQQATAQLALRESRLPPLISGARRSMYRLAVLCGVAPAALVDELAEPGALPDPGTDLPLGAPSELLLRRPDLRRLERELAAATARIGVSTADLYPRLTLTGSFAFEAADPGKLFNMDARSWRIGPAVRWNLLDGGRTRRQVEAADERSRGALIAYESRFLIAMEEVENSLVSFTQEQSRRVHLARAVEANTRAVQLATDRYTSGVGGFLDVLDGQRSLYDADEDLVSSNTDVTLAYISIFRALGGGWTPEELSGSAAPSSK
ncbi:MAG: efflux transporter outer membrane subunit [Phycisphaerales bacterium]